MRIEALEIDDPILDKIESRHGVPFHQAEEACFSPGAHVRRARNGLYRAFGQSLDGRYLLVVLADRGEGLWRVVTAREMTQTERRLYRRQMGG